MTTISQPLKINISPENTKLGKIASFSLPSITSCPGHTKLCASVCYAAKVERIYKNAKAAYEVNFNALQDPGFCDELISKISTLANKKKNPLTTFRWHVSGDIPTVKYLYDMVKVVKQFPEISFYAYTRNWSLPNWEPHLNSLRLLPNMTLFASLDDEHLQSNTLPPSSWRVAYFGDKTLSDIEKLIGNTMMICLEQTRGIKCDKCTYCYSSGLSTTTRGVYFVKH